MTADTGAGDDAGTVRTRLLLPGEPAPWFHAQALSGNPRYAFHTAGGRWMVVLLLGSGAGPAAQAALAQVTANHALFDDVKACFFGVTIDPEDVDAGRIAQSLPGIRWFLDYDRIVSQQFGAARATAGDYRYAPHWLLLDPMLRVQARAALADGAAIIAQLRAAISRPANLTAPLLIVPDVLPRTLCDELIGLYRRHGGKASGFMREENGLTVMRFDSAHKRRTDHVVTDERVLGLLKSRLSTILRPLIHRAFQFDATHIERFLVACYDEQDNGHFRAHRDNTTMGTAHRRFACTINLNAADYEGGDLVFPEFGSQSYRAPTGGAIIFSCSLLHQVQPVERGRRYAFLPFFYDEGGARLRARNLAFVATTEAVG